jgi:hypothetical protein
MAGSLIAGSDIRGYLRRVTAAREISAKSNEIPAFAPLLAGIDDEHPRPFQDHDVSPRMVNGRSM